MMCTNTLIRLFYYYICPTRIGPSRSALALSLDPLAPPRAPAPVKPLTRAPVKPGCLSLDLGNPAHHKTKGGVARGTWLLSSSHA